MEWVIVVAWRVRCVVYYGGSGGIGEVARRPRVRLVAGQRGWGVAGGTYRGAWAGILRCSGRRHAAPARVIDRQIENGSPSVQIKFLERKENDSPKCACLTGKLTNAD